MAIDVEYDSETETYRTVHKFSSNIPLSTTVVLAVEEVIDDMDAVLNDAIDPDALDSIFRPRSDVAPYRRGYVVFLIAGCRVTVRSDGTIEIDPAGANDFEW